SGYTVVADMGYMCRIDVKDADALGLTPPEAAEHTAAENKFDEKMVWDQLKTVYDPEIPVNIVDLGLIYACDITASEQGGKKIDVKMSMTAPGCGMGNVIKADVEGKLQRLPEVKEVNVEVGIRSRLRHHFYLNWSCHTCLRGFAISRSFGLGMAMFSSCVLDFRVYFSSQ